MRWENKDRFIHRAIEKMVGSGGQYSDKTEWVSNKRYNASTASPFSDAVAHWLNEIDKLEGVRFDGEGSGEFSSSVLNMVKPRVNTYASEVSGDLRRQIKQYGHIPSENILGDALVPPPDGGTMAIIANQFMDALPFTVLRQDEGSNEIMELCVTERGERYFQPFGMREVPELMKLDPSVKDGSFNYSPQKYNYIKNALTRTGITNLLIIDWDADMASDEFAHGLTSNGVLHSVIPVKWLRKMAEHYGGEVVYSGILPLWPPMASYYKMMTKNQWERFANLKCVQILIRGARKEDRCNVNF